jgi:hypothetical protein
VSMTKPNICVPQKLGAYHLEVRFSTAHKLGAPLPQTQCFDRLQVW